MIARLTRMGIRDYAASFSNDLVGWLMMMTPPVIVVVDDDDEAV